MYAELPTQTKEQICTLLCTEQATIDVQYANVQTHNNSSDYGGFALAFASTLCAGQSPENLQFIGSRLRQHILKCLEDEVATGLAV